MTSLRLLTLGTAAALALSAPFSGARADDTGYIPYNIVPRDSSVNVTPAQKLEVRRYMNYEYREPCQNYREVPEGYYRDGCSLMREKPQEAVETTTHKEVVLTPVVATYDLLFGFNSAVIEPSAHATLDQIAREIHTYNPSNVTVSGHADRAGPADYNVRLSERRAQAISAALTERGVSNQVLDQKAFGESAPAVDTQDGVRLRENRRVVVNFHK